MLQVLMSEESEKIVTDLVRHLGSSVVFSLVGVAFFGMAFFVMNKLAPFSIKKEIEDDQNIALAILMGSVILGIAIIIAATVSGG